ncbi:RICIN domain-containing protein [Kitasatospora purpeofusca]|uniref:RICIN domain-containing protein n=1 Tax=Kitasatospora purpeofusca TaxID=67352 RepID=UPI00367A97B3
MTDLRTYHYYALHNAGSRQPGHWAVTVVSPDSGEVLGTVTSEYPVVRDPSGLPDPNARGLDLLYTNSQGTHLYVGLSDGIHVMETQTLTEVWKESETGLLLDGPVRDMAVDHRRERLYVALGDGGVAEIDTTTNTVLRRLENDGSYAGVAVSPDGTRLYAGSSHGAPTLTVLDLADGTVSATVELAGFEAGPAGVLLALNEDGSLLYTFNSFRKDSLTVIDTATLTVAARGGGYTEAVWAGGGGQRVHVLVQGKDSNEGLVLEARTLERLGDFLTPANGEPTPQVNAIAGGPDGVLCLATSGGFLIATPAGDGRWEHQRVKTTGRKCGAVVAAAPTRYRAPLPARPARTVGVIKKSAHGHFHRVESGQMVENAYGSSFRPGERVPETTEVVQGRYKRGDRVTYIWYPIGIIGVGYKYFYYVPFWGVYIDGDAITWDDEASAAVPALAGLVARHSGKLVEIADGDRAQQWERRDADNQRFALEAVEDGFYRITAKHSGKVLEVIDAGTDNGIAVRQGEYNGGEHQQWRPEPVGDGWYRLVVRHSGRVLQIALGSDGSRNGAPVRQQEWANADHQKFRLDPLI